MYIHFNIKKLSNDIQNIVGEFLDVKDKCKISNVVVNKFVTYFKVINLDIEKKY